VRAATKLLLVALAVAATAWLGWRIRDRLREEPAAKRGAGGTRAVPVEVAAIERGPIELQRTFSGTLEAPAEFVVAPKVGGRVEELTADLADTVQRGQVVARLDNDEFVQAVAQAEADLAVAHANRAEAESALEIAKRALDRANTLRDRGVASESQYDVARAEQLSKEAGLAVANAQVKRAEAALETARIRLGYTEVRAGWTGGDDERVVSERFVDEGDTVSPNAPLLRIVELDPITGVIFVAERDYALLRAGQTAVLRTDAYPLDRFEASIDRIAPVFRQATRQARVELKIANPQHRLKPGMFIRATIVLDRVEDATIVPAAALTTRNDRLGIFVVAADGASVVWREVKPGIRAEDRVQLLDDAPTGNVVTLGQQLLDDGAAVSVLSGPGAADAGAAAGAGAE